MMHHHPQFDIDLIVHQGCNAMKNVCFHPLMGRKNISASDEEEVEIYHHHLFV
jgi:hypothetical protein